jgi:hypothetical protein
MNKINKAIRLITISLLLLLMISACGRAPSHKVGRCFYYWKSVFELDDADRAELEMLKINRLYLKFFDVVWDQDYGGPVPVSMLEFKSLPSPRLEIVPVVFITVDALERLPAEQCNQFSLKIHQKINFILRRNQLGPVSEIQLDCDWNTATRVKYFTILARLRKPATGRKTQISATIRLHQVKYASQTGIPPVDKGMLMFYNFDSPKRFEIRNSILDLKVGKEYTPALTRYPLELDLALPLFSWGVLFQERRFQGLIGNLHMVDLINDPHFQKVPPNSFRALADCRFQNIRICKNDLIRVEESRYEEVLASARFLAGRIRNPRFNVALFHFDRNLIQGVGGREKIKHLYHSFH